MEIHIYIYTYVHIYIHIFTHKGEEIEYLCMGIYRYLSINECIHICRYVDREDWVSERRKTITRKEEREKEDNQKEGREGEGRQSHVLISTPY